MIKLLINNLFYIKFDFNNLIFCNLLNIFNFKLLMCSWTNISNLYLSLFKSYSMFFSRKKHRIWFKGYNSKNFQIIKKIYLDCDMDIINYYIIQLNKISCHINNYNCIVNKIIL